MFRKLALILVVAFATCSDASAGFFHYYHHSYHYHYSAPSYNVGYVAPAPVVYYRVPIYIIPAQPACGAAPLNTSVRYRQTPHRSVYRVRTW